MPGAAVVDVVVDGSAVVGGTTLCGPVVEPTAPADTRSVVDDEVPGLAVLPQETRTAPRQAARVSSTTRLRARTTDMAGIKANGCTNPVAND
jgi:hypothetical protein